ncbi:efflux RND transporter periplasmic adaptor subunit [Hirschia baltica]|uniref:Efflux transporter, RND family, MFP subunit n=1 Tax=Hirschia baltica (strain ATCC 49814 / DSM 5838 / IFAM 1418) TaxID=582402 RepID=C6XNS9_HIRBI|nr:efflux RND transporter periplasmic adaptor subunit [Hirschia baltica]ACT58332.1 efflux transporter, RND family, MFP subunit [Hirschia baltica ATCC 49814]
MRLLLPLWVGLVLAACVSGCSDKNEPVAKKIVRPAKLEVVESSSDQREFSFPAIVEATQTAQLTFQIGGQISELKVLESQEVERGEIIARLDQRDVRNNLSQAKAQYENAEAEFARAERLFDQDAISKSILDSRRTQRDVAKAALDTAEKALSDTVMKAPFSGHISKVWGEQYQNVQAKEPIVSIQSEAVEVVFNLPSTIMARRPQLKILDTYVILDAQPEVKIPAVFKEASGQVDASSQTYEVRATFIAPDNLVTLPGMTATIFSSISVNGASDVVGKGIAVPLSSILAEGDARYVWVVDAETNTISKRKVELASEAGVYIAVTDGLEGGETIITAGVSFFHEGMTVREWKPE